MHGWGIKAYCFPFLQMMVYMYRALQEYVSRRKQFSIVIQSVHGHLETIFIEVMAKIGIIIIPFRYEIEG